ncbi:MAG: ABC transporter substrate-binding protein [Desulfovibrio sp.]|uniref:substrate-binding domain-containing protein n=1 Tax=Desulfovibrio sp. TaxID=885 RepID=UPI00135EC30A|nr:substrate-binding domain-containing protein [Desulfovibrio sp.]MTJ91941.1 ABC transporter substrate-binding protein [Desulfovibrio sp.]
MLLKSVCLAMCGTALLTCSNVAGAAEINVAATAGFASAYRILGPEFEKTTGNTLKTVWGPSMGDTPNTIPHRLERGEDIDIVIMVGNALDKLVKEGKIEPTSTVVLASSKVALAVRAGAPLPDISTVEALKQTLLNASSIAYSDSASGTYVSNVMIPKLGLAEALKDKIHMIPAEPVGNVVARGEEEIGFQQLSELKPIQGIQVVGLIPEEVQLVTLFSAGIVKGAKNPEGAQTLLKFLSSPQHAGTIDATGLEAASR